MGLTNKSYSVYQILNILLQAAEIQEKVVILHIPLLQPLRIFLCDERLDIKYNLVFVDEFIVFNLRSTKL